MAEQFLIPQEYESSIRHLIPHLAAPLQNNPDVLSSLLLYLKVEGFYLFPYNEKNEPESTGYPPYIKKDNRRPAKSVKQESH